MSSPALDGSSVSELKKCPSPQLKTETCDPRSSKVQKITSFFPLLKLDGKPRCTDSSSDSCMQRLPPSATVSSLYTQGELPSNLGNNSDVSDGDSLNMSILKAPITEILRSKMSSVKKEKHDNLNSSSVFQNMDSSKVLATGDAMTDGVKLNVNCDKNEDEEDFSKFAEICQVACEGESKKPLMHPVVLKNCELKNNDLCVYKARKGLSSYSAKTFMSTSALNTSTKPAEKELLAQRSDANQQPDNQTAPSHLSSAPDHIKTESQQSMSHIPNSQSENSVSSASSGVQLHHKPKQSFLSSSVIEANHMENQASLLNNLSSPSTSQSNQESQHCASQQSPNSPSGSNASSGLNSCNDDMRVIQRQGNRSFLPASSIEIPSQNATTKKQRRRHFKGGTYGLYLSPSKRRKNKKKSSDAGSVKDDELSVAGTENGSIIDSEGSLYSEDYYSPSEKSLLGDEPASPGRLDSNVLSEVPKTSSGVNSPTPFFNTTKGNGDITKIDGHSAAESLDPTLEVNLLSESSCLEKNGECETLKTVVKKEVDITGDCVPSDARNGESHEERDVKIDNDVLVSVMPTLVKQEFCKTITIDCGAMFPNTPGDSENKDDMMVSPASSIPPVSELSPAPSLPPLPDRVHTSFTPYVEHVQPGTTNDNAVSTIAKSVKSRQRIKRRFTDDIVDTDAGILSLNCMSGLKRSKDQPSVSPRSEVKIGHGAKVECVVDMKLPPVALCTCQEEPLVPKDIPTRLYCQASDSFFGQRIGCSNVCTIPKLVRVSVKNPFVYMCRMHFWRLGSHHACPVCGIFCSEGTFTTCRGPKGDSAEYHYSHEDCCLNTAGKLICLHCGNESNIRLMYLEFHSPVPPGFSHKQATVSLRARMTVGNFHEKKEEVRRDRSYTIMNSGRVLSAVGLPQGSDRLRFEAMLATVATEKTFLEKYAIEDMYVAASSGVVEKVLYMMAAGFNPNYKFENHECERALHVAAATGNLLIIHVLIQAGAVTDPLNDRLYTPLMLAIENGHRDVAIYLCKSGANLQVQGEDGMTCLHLAAKSGLVDMCKILLNAKTLDINMQDDGGWTALVWATEHKHLSVVYLLVHFGADPNITDNEGNIGLHWAAFSGSHEICQLFLELGCDVDAVNEHGDTPLHIAARQDYYECINLFLLRNGNSFAVNKALKTPIDCCISSETETYLALQLNMNLKKIISKFNHRAERVMHNDISKGREKNPIQCVNAVDDEPAPFDYIYVLENCETSPINFDRTTTTLSSCTCVKECFCSSCTCGNISFRCWYDKEGCLVPEFNFLDPPLIFECNRVCTCWRNCGNRVIQNGIVCRLQLMRTKGKGWGVRTLKDIPKGAFICEYVGELITDPEADRRAEDSYLFDLDYKDGDTFCLDAHFYGNISRFINHLCEPNIIPVKAFVEHQDLRYPRIAFFSSRDIKAYEELGFDYGEKFWSIKYKSFTCHCNAAKCKYSKDTIVETLACYNRRLKEEAG